MKSRVPIVWRRFDDIERSRTPKPKADERKKQRDESR
jgi:hypothetical protein